MNMRRLLTVAAITSAITFPGQPVNADMTNYDVVIVFCSTSFSVRFPEFFVSRVVKSTGADDSVARGDDCAEALAVLLSADYDIWYTSAYSGRGFRDTIALRRMNGAN